jgi:hypothetical protein
MNEGTIPAGADGATGGRMWLFSVDAAKYVLVRRFALRVVGVTAAAFVTNPRLSLERVTFTGAPTGAAVTPALADSLDFPAAAGTLRTASTGVVLTAGALVAGYHVPGVLTGVGFANGSPVELIEEGHELTLRNLEGLVLRQATPGSAGDTRGWLANIVWEEFDL